MGNFKVDFIGSKNMFDTDVSASIGTSDHAKLKNRDAANQHPMTAISGLVGALSGKQPVISDLNTIRSGAALGATALQSVPSEYVTDAELQAYHDSTKQDVISDLETIRAGASAGATALQSVPSEYVTDAELQAYHDSTKQDVISDLETIRAGASAGATAVQPETGKGLFSGSYNDLTDAPTIPPAVTETTVAGWGFTKNTGTYSKPTDGIPKTDLAAAVQESLDKADGALQSVPNTYRTAEEQDEIDAGKQDKAATATITISVSDWSGGTTCTKSVTGVTATSIVIVDTSDGNVECSEQGSGTLTFTATSTPTSAVTVKVVIL